MSRARRHGSCFWCGRCATFRCDRCGHWLCAPVEGCSGLRRLPRQASRFQLVCAWPCRTRRPAAAIERARAGSRPTASLGAELPPLDLEADEVAELLRVTITE